MSRPQNSRPRSLDHVGDPLDNFTRGILADAFRDGQRRWWLKRAEDFERSKPMPGEFTGAATREQLSARWRWCEERAQACRARAEMAAQEDIDLHLIDLGGAA